MCGIAGFLSLTGRPADPQRLVRMVGTLKHRGPDDQGYFTDGPVAIGAARLSIIDVAGGHQPISIDGGGITVAQNGEIYNYVELREELARAGRRTTTACDTEVIAHLYAAEGVAGFRRMRGMFAVAIWDAPRQRLILARDRVGKKPLYCIEHRGEWLFGSEAKAILAVLRRGAGGEPGGAPQLLHVRLRGRRRRDIPGHAPARTGDRARHRCARREPRRSSASGAGPTAACRTIVPRRKRSRRSAPN